VPEVCVSEVLPNNDGNNHVGNSTGNGNSSSNSSSGGNGGGNGGGSGESEGGGEDSDGAGGPGRCSWGSGRWWRYRRPRAGSQEEGEGQDDSVTGEGYTRDVPVIEAPETPQYFSRSNSSKSGGDAASEDLPVEGDGDFVAETQPTEPTQTPEPPQPKPPTQPRSPHSQHCPQSPQLSPRVRLQLRPRVLLQLRPRVRLQLSPRVRLQLRPRVRLQLRPRVLLQLRPRVRLQLSPRVRLQLRPRVRLQLRPRVLLQLRPRVRLQLSPRCAFSCALGCAFSCAPRVPPATAPAVVTKEKSGKGEASEAGKVVTITVTDGHRNRQPDSARGSGSFRGPGYGRGAGPGCGRGADPGCGRGADPGCGRRGRPRQTRSPLRTPRLSRRLRASFQRSPAARRLGPLSSPSSSGSLSPKEAFAKIQAAWKGHEVRAAGPLELLKKIRRLSLAAQDLEAKVSAWEGSGGRVAASEKLKLSEGAMSLLLALDSIHVPTQLDPVRQQRRELARQLSALQDKIDALKALPAAPPSPLRTPSHPRKRRLQAPRVTRQAPACARGISAQPACACQPEPCPQQRYASQQKCLSQQVCAWEQGGKQQGNQQQQWEQ